MKPDYEIHIEPNGAPRLNINNSMIVLRGDPFIPTVEEADMIAQEYGLEDEDYTGRQLLEIPSFENVTDAEDVIDVLHEWIYPTEKEDF